MANIVFVDHNINNFHANTFCKLLQERNTGFRVAGAFANCKDTLAEWGRQFGVPVFDTIEALRDLADYVMVLAPSNPETHLELCRKAFALGKPTYIDKTFAPNLAVAEEIFALADHHGIPIQSTSVLRYTEVQEYCRASGLQPRFAATWATGGNFDEYIIHPVEMIISIMGHEVEAIGHNRVAGFDFIRLKFSGDREGHIHMHLAPHAVPYFAVVSNEKETRSIEVDRTKLFASGLNGILDFFRDPTANQIDRRETLAIMRILDELKALRR